jgi:DNA (cytosine-5)-methyltransferase 1
LAFSEIEDFPRAVLAHHYPGVPCHGDFTVLRDQPWIVDADVLAGGTPCQAFSVAGLRNSLDDARGNLSLEFVRLADAIDDVRKLADKDPAIIVWENVPGVLSVKDNAFGCFLAALAGDVDPYIPPRGKWTNAGVVAGPQRQVAWRVLDAQYFGLAQRRRRVFVVASARKGFDPAAVLLEFEGVRRDTAPRREAGQVAPTIPSRSTAGGGLGTDFDCDGGVIQQPVVMAHGQANAEIRTDGGTPALTCLHEAPIVAHTLKGEGFDASEGGTGRGTPLVPVAFSYKDSGADAANDLSPTLRALGAYDANGGGQMAVAVSLRGRDGGGTAELGGDIQNALRASQGGGDKPHVLAARPMDPYLGGEVTITIDASYAKGCGGTSVAERPVVEHNMAVRRLTARECERLQGFPDDYTMIPWKKKPADQCPDGPRYKALGNSMAVPCMRWIGRRIAEALR